MKRKSMENHSSIERWNRAGIEDNVLAMFDAHQDALDDRIAFLDAVRASSIVLEHGKPPTSKIYGALFHMLRTGNSLELIMGTYKLLVDLDKLFPRVYSSGIDNAQSPSNSPSPLILDEKAWSPIIVVSPDNAASVSETSDKKFGGPLDPSSFQHLIEELAEILTEIIFQASSVKPLQTMLLFQYLVIFLEGDFQPRNATMTWSMQRESLLNLLLGSRKINYKGMMKDCMSVICLLSQLQNQPSRNPELQESSESQLSKNCQAGFSLALLEVLKNTCVTVEKLLVMIMDLDMSRKKADIEGHTTRADGPRTPLMDIILEELAYRKDSIPIFLKIFSEPKWKLEIIVQYLWRYITRPSVRTRKSNGNTEDATFHGALKCLSNNSSTKSLMKKIGADAVQFLLAHGFQAQLSILSEGNANDKEGRAGALVELCKTFISAFDGLRNTDESMEILSIGKEALFTAATLVTVKS